MDVYLVEALTPEHGDKRAFYCGFVEGVPQFAMHHACLFYVEAEAFAAVEKLSNKYGAQTKVTLLTA